MYAPSETVSESAGLDEQLRERYAMKAFLDFERDTMLGRLHEIWTSFPSGANGLPILPEDVLTSGIPDEILHWTSFVDTRPENPMEYAIQACGKRMLPEYGAKLRETLFINIPCIFHGIQLAIECLTCKHDHTAAYQVINQTIGGKHSHYARLLLPVGDRTGTVVGLLHAVRPVRVPENAEAAT